MSYVCVHRGIREGGSLDAATDKGKKGSKKVGKLSRCRVFTATAAEWYSCLMQVFVLKKIKKGHTAAVRVRW